MGRLWSAIRGSRFARDSTILQAGSVMLAGLGLVGVLALSHILGASRQGEYYLAGAVFTALWFALNLGVSTMVTSKIATATERKDVDSIRDWMAYAVEATALTGALSLLVAWIWVPDLLSWWLGQNAEHAGRVATYAALLALEPLIGLPRLVCHVGFQGQRRMGSLTRMENSCELTRVILVVIGALWHGSVMGAVIGQLLAAVAGCGFAYHYYQREYRARPGLPTPGSILKRLGRVRLKGRWGEGVRMGLVRNIDAYSVQVLPALILDRYGSTQWVAYLRISQSIVGVLRLLMTGVGRTAVAALSQAGGHTDPRRLGRIYRQTTFLGGGILILGSLALLPFLPWFLDRFWPHDYVQPIWTCVLILMPGMWIMGFSVVNDIFYLLTGRLKAAILISIMNFVVQIPMLFWLAQTWPEKGVAVGLSFIYASSASHVLYALWVLRGRDHDIREKFTGPPSGTVEQSGLPANR